MLTLIDWILDLFRSEDAARSFVAAPEQSLRDAGLAGVSAAQLSSVAATAVPGLVLGEGDPIVGLQRAVSNQYGFAPAYAPSFDPVYAPSPTFAPQTDLASHNDTSLLSPSQDAGANAQQGAIQPRLRRHHAGQQDHPNRHRRRSGRRRCQRRRHRQR